MICVLLKVRVTPLLGGEEGEEGEEEEGDWLGIIQSRGVVERTVEGAVVVAVVGLVFVVGGGGAEAEEGGVGLREGRAETSGIQSMTIITFLTRWNVFNDHFVWK